MKKKDTYKKTVLEYKYYIINLSQKKAVMGFEFKQDAIDSLEDFDDKRGFKIYSKVSLKSKGIKDPTEEWLKY